MTERDLLEFLTSSNCRTEVLRALKTDDCRPTELVSLTSVSRSSIQRCLRELEQERLVEKTGRTYRLTHLGSIAYDEYRRACETLTVNADSRELINNLNRSLGGFDPTWLDGTNTHIKKRHTPEEPVREYVRCLENLQPEYVRGLCPVRSTVFEDLHHELLANGTDTRLVIPDALVEEGRDALDPEPPIGGDFDLRVSTTDFGFGLCVCPDRVLVSGFTEGQMTSFAELGGEQAQAWGESVFESYWKEALNPRTLLMRSSGGEPT